MSILPECPCHSISQRFAGGNIDGYKELFEIQEAIIVIVKYPE